MSNASGLVSEAGGRLRMEKGRKWHNSRSYEKISGEDHAGHLIADIFGGSGSLGNIVSMAKDVNLKHFARLEKRWYDALESGKAVDVKIKVNYKGGSKRPDSFDVEYKIEGSRKTTQRILNKND